MDSRAAAGGGGGMNAVPVITGPTSSAGVQPGTILTRTLYVNITGSLAALEMGGPSAGSWKLVDGKCLGVFGMGTEVDAQVCFFDFVTAFTHCSEPFDVVSFFCRWPRTSCARP